MTNAILIKSYGSRRLYNGCAGRYVTVEELRDLAKDEAVVIQDAEDGRDITDEILSKIRH
jgi:polyhydroxyalkanoate synthesis regulator protein